MRSWLVLPALVFAACSPPSPFVGTWRYDVDATVTTAMGTETKKGTFEIDLSAATVADLIDWRMGGCNFVLAIKGLDRLLDEGVVELDRDRRRRGAGVAVSQARRPGPPAPRRRR